LTPGLGFRTVTLRLRLPPAPPVPRPRPRPTSPAAHSVSAKQARITTASPLALSARAAFRSYRNTSDSESASAGEVVSGVSDALERPYRPLSIAQIIPSLLRAEHLSQPPLTKHQGDKRSAAAANLEVSLKSRICHAEMPRRTTASATDHHSTRAFIDSDTASTREECQKPCGYGGWYDSCTD